MARPYVTPGKTHGVRSDHRGLWNATVVRIDAETNRAWLRVPRLTGDLERGPVQVPMFPVALAAGDEVMVGFREGMRDSLVIVSRSNPPGSDASGWKRIDLPYDPDDDRYPFWTFAGQEFYESVQIVDGILMNEWDYESEFSLTNLTMRDPVGGQHLFGSGIDVLKEPSLYQVRLRIPLLLINDVEDDFDNSPTFSFYTYAPDESEEYALPNGTGWSMSIEHDFESGFHDVDGEEQEFIYYQESVEASATETHYYYSETYRSDPDNFDKLIRPTFVTNGTWVDETDLDTDDPNYRFGYWKLDGQGEEELYYIKREIEINMLMGGAAKGKNFGVTSYANDSYQFQFNFSLYSYAQTFVDLANTFLEVKQL